MTEKKCKVTWQWTNWTFGVWWGKYTKCKKAPHHFGIELGPFSAVWIW